MTGGLGLRRDSAPPPVPDDTLQRLRTLHGQRADLDLERIETVLRARFHDERARRLVALAAEGYLGELERRQLRRSADLVASLRKREAEIRQTVIELDRAIRRLTVALMAR